MNNDYKQTIQNNGLFQFLTEMEQLQYENRKDKNIPTCLLDPENKVILIDDYIGKGFSGDPGITSNTIRSHLKELDGKDATIKINSFGGSYFDGVAIYNILKNYEGSINVEVIGAAFSAASIIAQAGDTITMNAGTSLMIHPVQTIQAGTAAELRKEADVVDKLTENVIDLYAEENTKISRSQISKYVHAETFFSGAEAVANGFATSSSNNGVSNSINPQYQNLTYRIMMQRIQSVQRR